MSNSSATPWNTAHQAPLSVGIPRKEYWSGVPFPSPGIFLTQESNAQLLHWQADSLHSVTWEEAQNQNYDYPNEHIVLGISGKSHEPIRLRV